MENVLDIVNYAIGSETKLNGKALMMQGMSSPKVRNLLNKAVSYDNTKYLEIGVWGGSTFYSALYGNHPKYAVAIDNFSQFGGQEEIFLNNISDLDVEYEFINSDCFCVDKTKFKHKFNVYFYDGGHTFEDQECALTYYYDCLEDTFIYICDDYNHEDAQLGTISGIKKLNLHIIEEYVLPARFNGDLENFWNGIYIAKLKKHN